MSSPDNLKVIREFMRALAGDLKHLVENPEIIDEWTPAQRAWMMEHLELNLEEMKHLQEKIHSLLEQRGYRRDDQ
jgi:hypothetical protein